MTLEFEGRQSKSEQEMGNLSVRSPEFSEGDQIPERYTYLGENINPPLYIENVPEWSKSLILMVEDLDTPNGFINWLVYDIDPSINFIEEDSVPGRLCRNSSTKFEYIGCMPLSEDHQIQFTVFAVDNKVELPERIEKDELFNILKGYKYEKSALTGIVHTEASHWAIE